MATPLKKLNEIVASLIQTQAFTAALGSLSDDSVWALTAPKALNGNAILIVPGAVNQVVLKASALVLTVPLAGMVKVEVGSDTAIASVTTMPVGARTDGTNHFFSQFTSWNETPVLIANKFNHVYVVYDASKVNNLAIGVVANASITDPNPAILTNIGVSGSVSPRQAVCFVDATGRVTLLSTFPGLTGQSAVVAQDAPPSFADWAKSPTALATNVVQVQFTFPAGTGTGSVGEIAVKLGADIVAFLAVSPQLLKDVDVDIVLKWNLMIGEPGSFLP